MYDELKMKAARIIYDFDPYSANDNHDNFEGFSSYICGLDFDMIANLLLMVIQYTGDNSEFVEAADTLKEVVEAWKCYKKLTYHK